MTAILGISAYYHDSAAALVVDGDIVAAAQEERFTRKRHDSGFPSRAVEYCLQEAKLTAEQIDYVGFYDKPLLKFDRLLETYLAYAPRGFRSFARAMPIWLREKIHLPRELSRSLKQAYRKRFIFTEHHESHAASAFFPSPYEEAAILTLDGVGEWATATFGSGRGNHLALTHELRFPHSLGLLYSAFTYYCGFRVNSGEYKLMGLAPYGDPTYAELIQQRLLDLKADGSFRLDMSYFNYGHRLTMTSRKLHRLLGGPPRSPESPILQRHMDIAASIQRVTEEVMLRAARHVHQQTGLRNLCLAGGVALNCVGNGRILREGPFDALWIQPAAGDAGGSLGVALFIWHQLLKKPRRPQPQDSQHGSLLGPQFDDQQVRAFLDASGIAYQSFSDDASFCSAIAELLAAGKVVGWMQGRMEFGPRALGARSILGDPRDPAMRSLLNRKIKFRESFRPFAPSVLREAATDFFQLARDQESPYMLLIAPVQAQRRLSLPAAEMRGFQKLSVRRSEIPAVTHVDDSARIQTVDAERHGRFYQLLQVFAAQTGCPLLINTSFNVRGEPIVCTPEDAYRCFMATHMDALAMGNCLLLKSSQRDSSYTPEDHLAQFALD